VLVNGGFADPGGRSDGVDAGGVNAPLREKIERRFENLVVGALTEAASHVKSRFWKNATRRRAAMPRQLLLA
jgi:hypothetical protein